MTYTHGKCAVITGAGSGIGRALALRLNSEGCELYISDINPDTLAETVGQLQRADIPCDQQVLDVADRAAEGLNRERRDGRPVEEVEEPRSAGAGRQDRALEEDAQPRQAETGQVGRSEELRPLGFRA